MVALIGLRKNLAAPNRAPKPPFRLNRGSLQAENLVFWWTSIGGTLLRSYSEPGDFGAFAVATPSIVGSDHISAQAASFADGVEDKIDFGDETRYDLTTALTIVAKGTVSSTADTRTFISKGQGGQSTHAWDLKYHSTPNAIRASLRSSSQANADGVTDLALDTPFTAGVTWDELSGSAQIYLNGLPDGSPTAFAGPIQTTTEEVQIGGFASGYSTSGEMAGLLWDVRLYAAKNTPALMEDIHFDPWDLYWQPGRVTYFTPIVIAAGPPLGTLATMGVGR